MQTKGKSLDGGVKIYVFKVLRFLQDSLGSILQLHPSLTFVGF